MRKGRAGALEIALVLGLLAVVAVLALRWGVEGVVHGRDLQKVPELKGKSLAGALDALSPLGLGMRKESEEFNGAVPIGSVLRQNPAAGTMVREGKIVRVTISQGGETVFTPSIAGLPLRNAEMLLRQNQLGLGEVTEAPSLRMEKGLVLSQDPGSETSVERNALVNVVVSAGPPPEGTLLMPDFARKNLAEAERWARQNHAKLTVSRDPSSRLPYGTIQAQDPLPDFQVTPATLVKLTISGRVEKQAGGSGQVNFQYQVPEGSSESQVRIVLVDSDGERELFNALRAPGSRIDLSIPAAGRARVKIFLNGILVQEREL